MKYFEELKVKADEEKNVSEKELSQTPQVTTSPEQKDTKVPNKTSTSSSREQDLDVFLLGDLGSDDEGPGMLFTLLSFLYLIHLISH
jgi:hypothetical protein